MASDNATVVLPPVEQLPADATEISNTTWLGCIITPNALMAGDVVEVVSGVATAEECCKRCRGDMRCNLFKYCKQPGGCTFSWGPRTLSLEQAQCEWAGRWGGVPSAVCRWRCAVRRSFDAGSVPAAAQLHLRLPTTV